VWELAHFHHHRWFVPWPVLVIEYGIVAGIATWSARERLQPR
jgi:hypothetical protein